MATDLPALLRSKMPTEVVRPLTVYAEGDNLVICGICYSGDLFRKMALASPGTWLRIESRQPDGTLTFYAPQTHTERTFDALTGRAVGSRIWK